MKERAPDGVDFWPARDEQDQHVPFVFCHVEGTEDALVVTTEEGSEQSKSNVAEQKKTVKTVFYVFYFCVVLCCIVQYSAAVQCNAVLSCEH